MNKLSKGTTLIEIMISVALISIVLIFLFNILLDLKNEKDLTSKNGGDSVKRSSFTRLIQNDFIYSRLDEITGCEDGLICYIFHFKDAADKKFFVTDNSLIYDDEKWDLSDENHYLIDKATFCYSEQGDNSVLRINIPVTQTASSNRKLDVELTYAANRKINVENLNIAKKSMRCPD